MFLQVLSIGLKILFVIGSIVLVVCLIVNPKKFIDW